MTGQNTTAKLPRSAALADYPARCPHDGNAPKCAAATACSLPVRTFCFIVTRQTVSTSFASCMSVWTTNVISRPCEFQHAPYSGHRYLTHSLHRKIRLLRRQSLLAAYATIPALLESHPEKR
jgi:hypothetical protein